VDTPRPFASLSALDEITWDYRASGHSTHGHPLAPLRDRLRAAGLPDAKTVATLPHGTPARYAGLVICRQRPGTAAGVTFMTLEDETGFVNLVLWERVFETFPVVARTVSFLGVTGTIQKQGLVVHLVAEELWQPRLAAAPEAVSSRNFH
jgi:error-prone DNA polymerase